MIKGFILRVDGSMEEKEWGIFPDLEEMQDIVGGYIERVMISNSYISDDLLKIGNFSRETNEQSELIVNEEGLMKNLETNAAIYMHTGWKLFGDGLLFVGTPMRDDPNG